MSPKKKKCVFSDVISEPLDQLLKVAPGNPVIRTQVLAELKRPLPDEVTTYDEIVEWVETTHDPKLGFPPDEALDVQAFAYYEEIGTCDTYKASGIFNMESKVRLTDIVRVFKKHCRERGRWSDFKSAAAAMIREQLGKEALGKVVEDPSEQGLELVNRTMQSRKATDAAEQRSQGMFFDQVYNRLDELYHDELNKMSQRG